MSEAPEYWIVRFDAFAFDSMDEAAAYQEVLCAAFTALPESAEYASSSTIFSDREDMGFAHAITPAVAAKVLLEAGVTLWTEVLDAGSDELKRTTGSENDDAVECVLAAALRTIAGEGKQ